MTLKDVALYRFLNQYIINTPYTKPSEVVSLMGAVQAQDYLGSLWAIGLRLKNATEADIEKEITEKKIVRTWPMRGTLHFVTAEDARWMLKLLTPRIIERSAGIYRQSELNESIFSRCSELLIKRLEGGQSLNRDGIYSLLKEAGISIEGQRGIHILGHLAQKGILCFGPRQGKQQTFVLTDEWLPQYNIITGDEALAELALRYFNGHGPATLRDFTWWSGLKVSDVKIALELAKSELQHAVVEGQTYWFKQELPELNKIHKNSYLLPPFDEFLTGYTDRSASLPSLYNSNVFSKNGIFYPVIVRSGQVIGTWKRNFIKGKVNVEIQPFNTLKASQMTSIITGAKRYTKFLKKYTI